MAGVEDHESSIWLAMARKENEMLCLQRLQRATIDAALYALLVVELVKLVTDALKTLLQ